MYYIAAIKFDLPHSVHFHWLVDFPLAPCCVMCYERAVFRQMDDFKIKMQRKWEMGSGTVRKMNWLHSHHTLQRSKSDWKFGFDLMKKVEFCQYRKCYVSVSVLWIASFGARQRIVNQLREKTNLDNRIYSLTAITIIGSCNENLVCRWWNHIEWLPMGMVMRNWTGK